MKQLNKTKWKGQIYLFMAFSLAGTSVVSARFISDQIGVFTITSISLMFAFLFLLPVCGRKLFKSLKALSANDFFLFSLQAVFGIFLFRIFLLNGLPLTSSIEAGILIGTTPAITAVLAIIFLKEPFNMRNIAGIIATAVGVMTMQGLFTNDSNFTLRHLLGNLLVLCAATCESIFNILSRLVIARNGPTKKHEVPPHVQTAFVIAIAFILCLIPALFEDPFHRLSAAELKDWLSLVWYGVFVTAMAFMFWYSGIKRCDAYTAAAFSGMMPLTSMVLSVIILGEQASWQQLLGGLLVLSGMILTGLATASAKDSDPHRINYYEQTVK